MYTPVKLNFIDNGGLLLGGSMLGTSVNYILRFYFNDFNTSKSII